MGRWCDVNLRSLLFNAACYKRNCFGCPLYYKGCNKAPEENLLRAAREHYIRMKDHEEFDLYDDMLKGEFGDDYAKYFTVVHANVI